MLELIALTEERNSLNIFTLDRQEYLNGKEPAVGDELPLRASKRVKAHSKGMDASFLATYLDGIYEVVKVHRGKGMQLFPDLSEDGPITINSDFRGIHAVLKKKARLGAGEFAIVPNIECALT